MKTLFHRWTLISLFAAATLTALHAQPIQLAPPEAEANALGRMTGQTLRANNDEPITTVVDYLIEPRTGELRFAVVPTGAGPTGQTFRLVPMAALDPASNAQSLKLRINRAQWERVGTLTQDFLRHRVSIDTEHRRRLAQQFGLNSPLPGDGSTVELVRAKSLTARTIQSGNEVLGTIRDISVDLVNHFAWALVSPAPGFANTGRMYLLPLDRAQISDGQGAITTTLTRNDFAQATPAPTGFASSGPNMAGVVSAVEQAVQNMPSVPRGSVQVTPESRLVLRGTVDTEQQKADAHRAATQAAPGVRIDNELHVRSRW